MVVTVGSYIKDQGLLHLSLSFSSSKSSALNNKCGDMDRKRSGLCSSWLASLDPHQNVLIAAWFKKGLLPPPPSSLPLIFIGPGTGCAPFHGFVEERALQNESGQTAPAIFFFGCRNKDDDSLSKFLDETFTERRCDQPEKVYVQHKMREQNTKMWSLLSQGVSVYVAGSSNKTPSDVLSAFEDIGSAESGSKEVASRCIRALEKAGKYHVEAWS